MTLLHAVLLALLPGVGNLAGSLLAERMQPPRWVVGIALHGAAGIAIGVVAVELLPRARDATTPLVLAAAFAGGAFVSILIARLVGRMRFEGSRQGAWLVVTAVAVDLSIDGLLTGAGSSVSSGLGFLLAASQIVGNIPTGFAATANLRGLSRKRRFLVMAALPMAAVAAAPIGYLVLRDAGDTLRGTAMALMAGILLLATIEDTISEGDAPEPPRWLSSIAFALGFLVILLASTILP